VIKYRGDVQAYKVRNYCRIEESSSDVSVELDCEQLETETLNSKLRSSCIISTAGSLNEDEYTFVASWGRSARSYDLEPVHGPTRSLRLMPPS
jgi:hypothetical protein